MRAGVEPVCANANRVAFYIRATDLRDKNTPGYEALVERRERESTAPQKAPAIVAFGRGSSRKTQAPFRGTDIQAERLWLSQSVAAVFHNSSTDCVA